ncbi:MAG TPA: type 4a pilus biogenesis protein PilO [Clostridia bacterium]|nr:type 4a pilus biogenesis protein PilO [Clostridia bacterium]
MKIKLNKREVLLLSVLAVAAFIYGYLNYLIFPSYARIEELNSELAQKRQIAVDRDEAREKLELMDSVLEKNKAELADIEKMIPYNVKLPEIIVNIDSKISALDMDIQSIGVGEPDTANKEYDIVPVNVTMSGNYDSLIAFIKYIEDNERKFIIDSFTLAPVNRAEAVPFDISMRTFVLKDSEAAAIPEPQDYYFFRHNNGKAYPFLEGGKKTYEPAKGITDDIEDMEKKYDKLDNILDGFKGVVPDLNGTGEED